jgi:hypothetical protein
MSAESTTPDLVERVRAIFGVTNDHAARRLRVCVYFASPTALSACSRLL